jgi:predicted phage terminase large subunit-like protein
MDETKIDELLASSGDMKMSALYDKAVNSLYDFDKYILGNGLMEEHTHGGLCAFVESLVCDPMPRVEYLEKHAVDFTGSGDLARDVKIFDRHYDINEMQKKFRLILMPRGSFKTTVVTIGFTLQQMLRDPNMRILVDSEVFDKSRAFISEMKGHLETNKTYREIFYYKYGCYPDDKKNSEKWTDSELNIAARNQSRKEPNISAAGIGTTKVGMHYDMIICDDLHSEKNVTTKEAINQVIEHYKGLLSLLEPNGIMIVIGTRWDYNDVYQYIIDHEIKRFSVYARQAILPGGQLLFPERLTREFLENQKISQGSYFFSCQYQNLPIDDDTAVFKYSDMKRVDKDFIDGRPINWFLTVDPAISQDKYADYTAMVVAGYDNERNIYVKDIMRARMTPSEIVDNIFYLYEVHKPAAIGVENVAFQKTLQYALHDKMKERGWWLPVREIKRGSSSKEDRIKRLQPFYEYGHIYHLKNCANIDDLEYELVHFPKGQTDDMIDALSDIVEIGYPPSGRKAERSEDDTRKRKKLLTMLSKPRSSVTRY